MARNSGQRRNSRGAVLVAVVLFLVPGGIFFAKGLVELADRFAARTTHEATLLDTEVRVTTSSQGEMTRYLVRGQIIGGEAFEFDDERVYDVASLSTPLPVRVEVSRFSKRVLAVRGDFGAFDAVGGASQLRFAVLGIGLGAALSAVPFALPWQRGARKRAAASGAGAPPVDWGALVIVSASALAVVGATLAWDLLR